jgi:predicted dehydrogenase
MMDRVNCGVLGAGWWSTTAHLPALRDHPKAHLVAVQKRDRKAAEKVARDFGAEHAVTSVEEMMDLGGIDAVVIGSTPNRHFPEAKACLENGCHVLVEKPMTIKAAEAEELVALAEVKGLHLLISCPWHYTEHSREARRLVSDGRLGDLKLVSMLFTNFSGPLYRARSWKEIFEEGGDENYAEPYLTPGVESYSDPSVAGGGQLYAQVSHAAAYLGLLTGLEPTEIFAMTDNAEIEIDTHDALCVRLRNGCLVTLASTGDTMLSKRHFEIRAYGTDGMLLMELWEGTMEFHPRRGDVVVYPPLPEADSYPLHAPANNLVDVVLGEASNLSPGSLGAYAMRIIEASCESARTGENVKVG